MTADDAISGVRVALCCYLSQAWVLPMTVARTLVACGFMVIAGGLTYSAATTGNVGAGWGAFLAGLAALACVLLTGDPR